MSSRIRSGGSFRAASSASLPLGTGRTRYPRSLSMPVSTWRLAGRSSTTRMLAVLATAFSPAAGPARTGCPAPLPGISGCMGGSCSRTVDDPKARTRPSSPDRGGVRAGKTRRACRKDSRAEEIEELLVFEAFGQAAQPLGHPRIMGFDLLDLRQQEVEIGPDDGFAHQMDQVLRQ